MSRHDLLLARVPEELVAHARLVVDWLVGDTMEFSELGQADVQRLLWLDLPTRWAVPPEEWPDVAEAGARVLELANRPGLAEIARSDETRGVLDAYARSLDDGVHAANEAYARTGTVPPDTDLLSWGRTLTGAEANAYDELRRVLETAVVAGDYLPGQAGWRQRQRALAERWLTAPSAYFDGWRPIDVIHTVRREEWTSSGTQARCTILTEVEVLLREPVPIPDGEPAPLVWLLHRLGPGVRLTKRGYLPPALVREGDDLFGWSPSPRRALREIDVLPLRQLHEIVRHRKLVTKRHDVLRPSTVGRAQLEEPRRLWETAASAWLGAQPFAVHVAEIAAALLVKRPAETAELTATAHEAVAPTFRARGEGPVPVEATEEAVLGCIRRGLALGFIAARPHELENTLSRTGRLAALTALRTRSHTSQ